MGLKRAKWSGLVVGSILALTVGVSRASAQAAAAAEPDGAALYRQNCRSCHGLKGVAPARMASVYPTLKSLAGTSLSADSIAAVLRHGQGKDMKPFADRLSAAEIAAVAKFVKTLEAAPSAP